MNFYGLHELVRSEPAPKLHLRWGYNSDTFKSWLMSEITKDLAKELNQWTTQNAEELPFNDLFNHEKSDKYTPTRTIIPFQSDPTALSILEKIKQAGLTIDFKAGTVTSGKRTIRLGKYILSKISPFDEKEKEWWNHAGQAVEELERTHNKQQYVVLVSRNPIDIAIMSDHDGWTSCHSPPGYGSSGGMYYGCAISDAKGAGAIAYVVKKEDLAKVDLQAPEIFKDRATKGKRHDGIVPLSRVRLRKFVHKKDGFDLAVPEEDTYGKEFPGLTDSVRAWALQSQLPKLAQHGYGTPEEWKNSLTNKERPRMDDFQLMGGSYQDNQGSKLFNYMFDDNLDHGDADYGGEDDYQNMVDQMENEVNQIEHEYRNKFTICSFYASVEDGDGEHPYVSYSGTVTLEIPDELMLPEKKLKKDDSVPWSKTPQYQNREAVRQWAKDNDIYSINDVEINGNEVRIDIYDEDGQDADSFRSFLSNTLTDIDAKAKELQASLYHLFVELGLAMENKIKSISNNWDEHPHQFNNFKWEGDEPDVMVSLNQPIELPEATKTPGGYQHEYGYWQEAFKQALMKELNLWADKVVEREKKQPYLFHDDPGFKPEYKRAFSGEFKIIPSIKIKPGSMMGAYYGDDVPNYQKMYMYMSLDFETFSKDDDVDDAIAFVSFLDKNYPKFVSLVTSIYNKVWIANWGKAQPQNTLDLTGMSTDQQTAALNAHQSGVQPEPEKTWHQKNYPHLYGPDGQMLPKQPPVTAADQHS